MADNTYPIPSFHFMVEWGGKKGEFNEVSGLNAEVKTIEYRHGLSPNYTPIKMPGQQTYSNITCKRGIFKGDNQLFEWWKSITMNKVKRRDITISLLDEAHNPVMVWKIYTAWPVKVDGPSLNAQGDEVAFETLELAHEGLEAMQPGA